MMRGYVRDKNDGSLYWIWRPSSNKKFAIVDDADGNPTTQNVETFKPVERVEKPSVTLKAMEIALWFTGREVWFEPGYTGTVLEVRGEFVKVQSLTPIWVPLRDVVVIEPVWSPGTTVVDKLGNLYTVKSDGRACVLVMDHAGEQHNLPRSALTECETVRLKSGLTAVKVGDYWEVRNVSTK